MQKQELRSLIKNLLPAIDKVNKWHPNVIDAAIERVLIEMYNELFAENPLALQRFTKQYGYGTALGVSLEGATGLYYTTLPAKIVPFRDKASGVRRISTKVQGGLTFFPIDPREMDLILSGSNVDTITTKIGYVVNSERVEYYNMSGTVQTDGVRMDLIVPFSVYDDDDEVLVPETRNEKGTTFTDRVLAILGVVQPKDLKDDNAETKRESNTAK